MSTMSNDNTMSCSISQKKVHFVSERDNEIISVPHRRQFNRKQLANLWFTADDYDAINADTRQVVAVMDSNDDDDGDCYDDGINCYSSCDESPTSSSSKSSRASHYPLHSTSLVTRGLESKTRRGAMEKKIITLDGLCAVLLEQERQRQQCRKDPDGIRAAYLGYSLDAALAAAKIGLEDAADCEQSTSKTSPTSSTRRRIQCGWGQKAVDDDDTEVNSSQAWKQHNIPEPKTSPSMSMSTSSSSGSQSPVVRTKQRSIVKRLLLGRIDYRRNGSLERLTKVSSTDRKRFGRF